MTTNERWRGVAVLSVLVALVACGGGGGDGATPDSRAPSGLSYAVNPAEYVRGQAIAPNVLHQDGGEPATAYTIAPALPAGLTMEPSTGQITGTPTAVSTQTTYTVTATNAWGSGTVGLKLSVRAPAGHLISGTVYGVQPQLGHVAVYRADNDALLAETNADLSGRWSVEGAMSGAYRVEVSPRALASSYKLYPSTRTVTVTSSDVPGVDFCIADMDDQATICKVTLSTTTATIGGDPVPFTADIVNWGATLSPVNMTIYIEADLTQNQKIQGCGSSGQVPSGACTATGSFSVPANWDQYPGGHEMSFELTSSGLLSAVSVPITLVE